MFTTLLSAFDASGQTSAFTYQGHLMDGGSSANGSYDVQFTLKSAATGGVTVAGPLTVAPLSVVNGLFNTQLDFGGVAFDGGDRFVELAVRPFGSAAAYTVLAPRQKIASVPYAVKSLHAGSATSATSLTGTLTGANIPAGTITSGMITTGLDAAKLNTGVVSNTELNFLDGVTAGIQGQLDAKLNKAGDTMAGGLTVGGNGELVVAGPTARFAVNTSGYPAAAATIRGRTGDDAVFKLESPEGYGAFSVNNSGDTSISGNLFLSGAASRLAVNTPGYPNVAATLKGRAGDASILAVQSSGGSDVFLVNDAGSASIRGLTTIGEATGTARFALNTSGYGNVAATLKGRAGDNSILTLQSSGGTDVFMVNDAGRVGIGTISPGARLHIKAQAANNRDNGIRLEHFGNTNRWNIHTEEQYSNLTFSFNDQFPGGNYSYLNATQAGLISVSDRSTKKDIAPLTGTLDQVARLRPVSFRYKTAAADSPPNYGFIAQEVEEVFPDLVLENQGLKTLAANSLTAINTRAVQELHEKLKAKEEEMAEMKKDSIELKQRLEKLERLLRSSANE
jgi:hypothetical protein